MGKEVHLSSLGSPWRRLFDTSIAQASGAFLTSGGLKGRAFTSLAGNGLPEDTAAGLKVIDLRAEAGPGGATPNAIMFKFFGTNTSNQTFNARVWGIERGFGTVGTTKTQSWETCLLAQFGGVLGANGDAAGSLIGTDLVADTITLTYGASQDVVISSPANDLQAWARLDNLGFPVIGVELDDAGSAVTINGLYRLVW